MSAPTRDARLARAGVRLVLVGFVTVVLVASFVGFVTAGDSPAMFFFEPDGIDVDAGETVTVDIYLQTDGGYQGEGASHVALGVDYDPDVLTATDVERGPHLEGDGGAEVEVSTDVDEAAGVVRIEQERTPPGDGVVGTDVVATVTFEVASDATPTNTELSITDRKVTLIDGLPQATIARDGTFVVEGGGESEEPQADDESPDGVILADDVDGSHDGSAMETEDDGDRPADDESRAEENGSSTAEAVPGFGAGTAICGLILACYGVVQIRTRK